jgi:hypothetical protein
MDDKAFGYVTQVKDHEQFLAARRAYDVRVEGETTYMYQRSSSSTAESVNAANKLVRDRTAVDLINAMILLLKWKQSGTLTTRRRLGNGNRLRSLHLMDRSLQ